MAPTCILRLKMSYATMLGCGERHEAVTRRCSENGADVDSKALDYRTPLSWAAENGHRGAPVVKAATQECANLHTNAPAGRTPLWWAARNEA